MWKGILNYFGCTIFHLFSSVHSKISLILLNYFNIMINITLRFSFTVRRALNDLVQAMLKAIEIFAFVCFLVKLQKFNRFSNFFA